MPTATASPTSTAVTIDYAPLPPNADPARLGAVLQGHRDRQGRPRPRIAEGGCRDRGRVPHRAPGAALHRDQRGHRGAVATAQHDRLRIAAVPLLRAPGAGRAAGPAARQGARRADRDRRRLRRQGRVSVDARVPRGDPGAQGRPAGEDDLRPRRGSAGHDQAAPVDRPASHRADARRPADRDGHRRGHGRRRLLHAQRRSCCRAA